MNRCDAQSTVQDIVKICKTSFTREAETRGKSGTISSLCFLVPCTLRRLYVYRKRWKTSGKKSHESYQPGENGLIYRPLSPTFAKADAQARKRIPGKEYAWNIEASSIRLHSSRSATRKNAETSLLPRHQLDPRGKWHFSALCKKYIGRKNIYILRNDETKVNIKIKLKKFHRIYFFRSSKNNYNFLYCDTREKEIHYRAIIFIKSSTVLSNNSLKTCRTREATNEIIWQFSLGTMEKNIYIYNRAIFLRNRHISRALPEDWKFNDPFLPSLHPQIYRFPFFQPLKFHRNQHLFFAFGPREPEKARS